MSGGSRGVGRFDETKQNEELKSATRCRAALHGSSMGMSTVSPLVLIVNDLLSLSANVLSFHCALLHLQEEENAAEDTTNPCSPSSALFINLTHRNTSHLWYGSTRRQSCAQVALALVHPHPQLRRNQPPVSVSHAQLASSNKWAHLFKTRGHAVLGLSRLAASARAFRHW